MDYLIYAVFKQRFVTQTYFDPNIAQVGTLRRRVASNNTVAHEKFQTVHHLQEWKARDRLQVQHHLIIIQKLIQLIILFEC